MLRSRKFLFIGLGALCSLYLIAGYYFSSQIVAFGTKTLEEDLGRMSFKGPGDFGLPDPEVITITGHQGVRLEGFFFKNPDAGDCGVIIQHGFTGTRWGAVKFIPLFWDRGCDIVAMDARFHGNSGGAFATLGYFERYDMQRVLAWFQRRTGLEKRQIGLMGISMGGAIVLLTAALEPEVAFVAADAPYSDLGTILTERAMILYGQLLRPLVPIAFVIAQGRAGFDIQDVAPGRHAAKIEAPVFLTRSDADVYTPPYHTDLVYERVAHERRVLIKTDWGSEHGRCIDDDRERYTANFEAFMDEHVPDFGK